MLTRSSRAFGAGLLLFLLAVPSFAQSLTALQRKAQTYPWPPVLARSAIVVDGSSGKVLAAKNPHEHLAMASTTKIMTAILALKLGHLSDRIVVPKGAFNFESDATVMGLKPGEAVTLRSLLYGLLLPSGADAADTIAIHYAGSEAHFVTLMNREAHSLGMHDTHYATPHGLDAPHQYSSAYDLALLGRYATGMQSLMKIVDTRTYLWNGHLLTNVNQVLFWYPGVDGIKPGFTDAAGLCQVLDARRDGRHVIVAILHTPDLVHDARNLLNFGLRDFRWTVSPLGDSPAATEAGTDRRGPYVYYPATGHFLRPPFWNAYQDAGGSLTLGYPRTEPLNEGSTLVQYFQDGALTENLATKRITRLALGASLAHGILPPTPTSTPTATPVEGTIGTPGWPGVSRTPTPAPTSTPLAKPLVARPLQHYIQKHRFAAGPYAGPWHWEHGFQVQIFRYSALAYSWRSRTVYVLPVGDRYLAGRTMLPAHPGNSYPSDFAPPSVLAQLGW